MKNVIVALIAFALAGITGPKLYKMTQIKQWVPGASVRTEIVSQKWHQTPEQHYKGRDVYWISWGDTPIEQVGDHRINVEPSEYSKISVGDPLELITVGNNSESYLRNGIFVDPGNFAFDFVLLILELSIGTGAIVQFVRHKRRSTSPGAAL